MKITSILLALAALLFTDLVLAAGAIASSVTGTVTVQSGTAAARPLRQGDTVTQGDTVVTGPASSAILRFDDGEITALTANTKLAVTAYQYEPSTNKGNVFLSLVSGGMRAITGLIGRTQPSSVAYRAATATIGIRGTTVDVATNGFGDVAVSVVDGSISFGSGDNTFTLNVGQAAILGQNGKITPGDAAAIYNLLPQDLKNTVGSIQALAAAIAFAQAGGTGAAQSVTSGDTHVTSTISGGTGGGGSPH